MLFNYSNVFILALVGIGFIFVSLLIGSFLRPSNPTKEKRTTYECGEPPVGTAWVNFNIRFYIIALVFVIFDVEMAFMFPVVKVFKDWVDVGHGMIALVEVFAFILILLAGFAYVWKKGDLNWVKRVEEPNNK